MKLKDPRITLLAGLALALGLDGSTRIQGADVATKSTVRLVKAQFGQPTVVPQYNPAPVPSGTVTPGTTVPLAPIPDPSNLNLNLQPTAPEVVPPATSPSMAPAPLGTPQVLPPANRPPMGLFYGEQEQLDGYGTMGSRPLAPMVPGSSVPLTIDGSGASVPLDVGMTYGNVDRFGYAPPPGTLGQTYKRRSRLIEDTKHPRVGAVEVNLPEYVDVTARGLKVKWTGKVWRLESDSLVPGVPHIYEVKASWGEGTTPQYRTVRLIMGRIVELDF